MELFNRRPALGYRFLLLMFVSAAIMVLDHREQRMDMARGVLAVTVSPLEHAVSWPVRSWSWLSDTATSFYGMSKENAQYKEKLALQSVELQKLAGYAAENDRLRALLGAAPKSGEKISLATLLAVDSDPYVNMYTLAKGSRDKVYQGQSVLDATGLLGQVIRVGLTTSQVLLLTDTRSAVPIEDARNGVRSIAVGKGPNQPLALVDVPKTEGIKVGDVITTSGLGARFAAGYPVGAVLSVVHNPGEHFATILVQPSAEFNRSRLVLLLWPKEKPANLSELKASTVPEQPQDEASELE